VKAYEIRGRLKGKQEPQMDMVMSSLVMLRRFGQKVGPYLMLEILLPGGTLFALLLFLYRRRKLNTVGNASRTGIALARALVGMVEQFFVLQPCYVRPSQAFHIGVRNGRESHAAPTNRRCVED
jgi:hypothetical protein